MVCLTIQISRHIPEKLPLRSRNGITYSEKVLSLPLILQIRQAIKFRPLCILPRMMMPRKYQQLHYCLLVEVKLFHPMRNRMLVLLMRNVGPPAHRKSAAEVLRYTVIS